LSTPAVVLRPRPLPLTRARGRSLRVRPLSYCAPVPYPLREPGGEAFEYTCGRFAPPFSSAVLRRRGVVLLHVDETGAQLPRESLIMYRPPSPHPKASPEGAKPPRTPAIGLRPPFLRLCCVRGRYSPTLTRARGEPPRTPAVVLRPLFSSGVLRKRGEAFSYTLSLLSPPFPPYASPEGAKPSSTPAVVLRPLFLRVYCGEGAQPPRTPAVVYRPPSPTRRRTRGAASAYPYASQGRAFSYTLLRLSPPHPGEQD